MRPLLRPPPRGDPRRRRHRRPADHGLPAGAGGRRLPRGDVGARKLHHRTVARRGHRPPARRGHAAGAERRRGAPGEATRLGCGVPTLRHLPGPALHRPARPELALQRDPGGPTGPPVLPPAPRRHPRHARDPAREPGDRGRRPRGARRPGHRPGRAPDEEAAARSVNLLFTGHDDLDAALVGAETTSQISPTGSTWTTTRPDT